MKPLIVYYSTISNINMAIGGLYWAFIMTGFRLDPRKRYYRKLIENFNVRMIHGLISMILFAYGLIRIYVYNCNDWFLLFSFIYFILLITIDFFYRKHYKRTIILILRYDNELDNEMNIWDKIASVFIIVFPIGFAFIIGFLMI